jgi:energy-coupling factor transporter ATP-binding protein EcfA2
MRIDTLNLSNFGPHTALGVEFSPRLTGIIGPNGSGKSTLIDAIELLVTGAVSRAGAKDANVREGAGTKARSFVSGTIVHGPHRLDVVRGLRRTTSSVRLDGGVKVEGETRVTAELRRILGPAVDLFSDYVAIRQGLMAAFLSRTPGQRDAAYAQLFGTARMAKIHDALRRKLQAIPRPRPSAETDALRRRVGDEREALVALRARKARYDDLRGYDPDADPNAGIVARYEDQTEAIRLRDQVVATLDEALRGLGAADAALAAAEAGLDHARKVACAAAPAAAAAQDALKDWAAYERRVARRAELARRREALERERADHPRPRKPAVYYVPARRDEKHLEDLTVRVRRMREFLDTFDRDGVQQCPTCGTPTDTLDAVVTMFRVDLPHCRMQLKQLRSAHARSAQYDAALAEWTQWTSGWKVRTAQLDRDEADLAGEPGPPAGDRATLQATCTEFDRLTSIVRSAERALTDAQIAHGRAARDVEDLQSRRAVAESRIPKDLITDDAFEQAADALAAIRPRLTRRHELIGEVRARKRALLDLEATLAGLEAEAAASVRDRRLAGRLEALRSIFDRQALPRTVAAGYLGAIELGVNRMLDRFGADFRVETRPDLGFDARFVQGPLSGAVPSACSPWTSRRPSWTTRISAAWTWPWTRSGS